METSRKHPAIGLSEASAAVAPVHLEWLTGGLRGAPVQESTKKLGEMKGLFHDEAAFARIDPATVVYQVRWWSPVPAGEEGGLFWGVTLLQPGRVGDEYFLTHGHFHANRTRAEYYATAAGNGLLIRMDDTRRTWAEEMGPGTLHAISGQHAHRVVNIGSEPLIFWACWGSDAGYDYKTIRERGFGARIVERNGQAVMVSHE
ncbi:MAG TPA: glucose-6-phosphate isomerase family protein [Acidobacteriaceae bacterium]|jgi:glucose-6-phosphate isomerase|nr:glucose-6-phosphate isomerase family protein [Acidobacteriaceae bacterium]